MKKMKNLTNKKPIRRLYCIIIVLAMVCIMIFPLVSALSFDNTKSPVIMGDGISKYGKIEIKDWFGLLSLADLEVKMNTDRCSSDCKSETEIVMYQDGVLIDEVRFETLIGKERLIEPISSYKFYIKTGESIVRVDDYEDTLLPDKTYNRVKVGSHDEVTITWEEYTLGDEVKAGTYYVKLEGVKSPRKTVDWIIKSQGIWLDDWLPWAADFEVNLVSVWNLEEVSGTVADQVGDNDGINHEATTQVPSIHNYGYLFGGTNITIANSATFNGGNKTVSVWVNKTFNSGGNELVIIRGHEGTAGSLKISGYGTNTYQCVAIDDGSVDIGTYGTDTGELGKWVHIACTVNQTDKKVRIYINGTLQGTSAASANDMDLGVAEGITIGIRPDNGADNFTGMIDEVYWYNDTKSGSFISDLYNNSAGTFFGGGVPTLVSPVDNYNSINSTIFFNATFETSNVLVNSTLYVWNPDNSLFGINESDITGTSNTSYRSISNIPIGDSYKWNYKMCDSTNNCIFASNNRTFNYHFYSENAITYATPLGDLSNASFVLNISLSSLATYSSATFSYNGTLYSPTKTIEGSNNLFTNEIITPPVNVSTVQEFYWILVLSNGTLFSYNSTKSLQTITPSYFGTCNDTYPVVFVNYTTYNENNLSEMLNTSLDTTFTWSLFDGELTKSNSYTLTNTSYLFCGTPNQTFYVGAELKLSKNLFSPRNYFFDATYSNTTTHQPIYLLNESAPTDVAIILKDSGLTPLESYVIKIYRFVESTGNYILVENGKTDAFGQMIAKLEEKEVKYKFEFYNPSGTLIKTINNVVVICRSSTLCIQQFIIEDTSNPFGYEVGETDYSYTFEFNNNTNIFSFVWVDNRDTSSIHRLEVIRNSVLNGSSSICNSTSGLDSGILTCGVGDDRYSYTGSAYRTSDGRELRVDVINVEVGNMSDKFGLEGFFWSLVLLATMALVGIYYPPVGVGLYLVGIFMLGTFDILYVPPALMIAEIVLGVLFIWSFRA